MRQGGKKQQQLSASQRWARKLLTETLHPLIFNWMTAATHLSAVWKKSLVWFTLNILTDVVLEGQVGKVKPDASLYTTAMCPARQDFSVSPSDKKWKQFYLSELVLMFLKVYLKQNIENVSLSFLMIRDALMDRLPIIIGQYSAIGDRWLWSQKGPIRSANQTLQK